MKETGTIIPEYRRLPGYPAFLVLSSLLTRQYFSKAAYYVQGVLSLIVIGAVLLPLRRRFGSLFTIFLLGLLAAPNFWVRSSVFAFPDFLAALLSVAFAIVVFAWIETRSRVSEIACAIAMLSVLATMILLKSGMTILIAFFAGSLVVARLVAREPASVSLRHVTLKAGALVAAALALQSVILTVCGSGSVVFYRNAVHSRIATYLPPASDTEYDREVERAKAAISAREGQRMEDENFTNSLAVVQPAIERVWWDRLKTSPVRYLGVMLDEIRRKHYLVGRSFTPFMADTTPHMPRIPRRDGSPASSIYRATGFFLPGYGETPYATAGALADTLLRTLLLWGTVAGGLVLMWRRAPFIVLTLALTFVVYVGALTFGVFVDGRYLLPFAPAIYILQAFALSTLVTSLVAMGTAGRGPRAGGPVTAVQGIEGGAQSVR